MIKKKLSLVLLLFIFIYLASCGQQIMKDEGLDKKSIEEVGSSNAFSVVSVNPADGAIAVDKNINISLTFNKEISSVGAGTSTNCGDQLFYLSLDSSYGSCVSYQNNCGYSSGFFELSDDLKTIQLCLNALSSNANYYIKVVASATANKLESSDKTVFTEFTSRFTTGN